MSELSWRTKRKGFWIFKDGKVVKDVENDKRCYFIVKSEEKDHSVIFDKTKKTFTCDCEFFSLKLKDCSHIYAVKLFMGDKDGKN
ncbi:MAG: hypothetical protein QXF12_07420 [Candidatus Aenigmatarchaeota archaeon]